MQVLRDLPIRYKLTLTTMLTTVVALLVASAAFITAAIVLGRATLVQKQATLGAVIARNSTAALSFKDPDRAKEILAALVYARHVVQAGIYARDGELFAQYVRGSQLGSLPARPPADGQRFTAGKLVLATEISMPDRPLGTLFIESDLTDLHRQTRLYLLIAALVLVATLAVAFWIAGVLQRVVSRPILALADTARTVSEKADYSVRATKLTGDELGLLADAFNEMLRQIESREAELRQSHDKLEQRVTERTVELQTEVAERQRAEEAVKRQATELVRSNKELEQFAYIASHDLQEPLRMVTSYLQLLASRYKGRLDKEATEFMGFAVDGAGRMRTLIKDLLEYSRVGRRAQPFASTDCGQVLQTVIGNLRTSIQEHGARVEVGKLPMVWGDSNELVQLFQNLISNAIKFHGDAPPVVHIEVTSRDHAWLFSVRDNGIGIEPQYADRIFVIFQRLHSREKYPGTGIGLAICKKIVEHHGGRIWMESQPGQGSTFFLSMPKMDQVQEYP